MITAEVTSSGNYDGNYADIPVLDSTPGTFRIPLLHQYDNFVSQDNFFYGDDYRKFFVKPYNAFGTYRGLSRPIDSINNTTSALDNYLNSSDTPVGTFFETTYDTHEVGEVIFGSGPLDHLDPDPGISTKIANSLLDGNAANQQVDQLGYLGDKKPFQ